MARLKWNQNRLARESGVSEDTIRNIIAAGERGSDRTASVAGMLAHALGVDVAKLEVGSASGEPQLVVPGIDVSVQARILRRLDGPPAFPPPLDDDLVRRRMLDRCVEEAVTMLTRTDFSDLRSIHAAVRGARSAGPPTHAVRELGNMARITARASTRQGPAVRPKSLRSQRLRVHVVATMVGAAVLFEYLRLVGDLPLDLTLVDEVSAQPLRERMLEGIDADLVVVPLVSAARLLTMKSSPHYHLVSVMPRGSHRILGVADARGAASTPSRTTYLMLGSRGGTAHNYLQDLHGVGLVDLQGSTQRACSSAEISAKLAEEDPDCRAVLYFPLTAVHTLHGAAHYRDNGALEAASKEAYAFMSRRLCEDPQLVDELVVWFQKALQDLQGNRSLVQALVEVLFCDAVFVRFLAQIMCTAADPAKFYGADA